MQVEDDGIGFDVEEAFSRRDCFGLSGLRERVALLGGALEVRSLRKAKTAESAGWSDLNQRREKAHSGRIGIDRSGTMIRVVLPRHHEMMGRSGRNEQCKLVSRPWPREMR